MIIIILSLVTLFLISAYLACRKRTLKEVIFDVIVCVICIGTIAFVDRDIESLVFSCLLVFWIFINYLIVFIYPKITYAINWVMSRITKMPMSTHYNSFSSRKRSIKMSYYSIKIGLFLLFLMSLV